MSQPVFVDASAWVAITNRKDQNHNESVRIYRRLLGSSTLLITTTWTTYDALTIVKSRPQPVNDTPPGIEWRFSKMLFKPSGEERLKMGCSMHATARALVIASIPEKDEVAVNRALFLRFYGDEFESKKRKRILPALRKAAETREKRAQARVVFEPTKAANEMHVGEPSEAYPGNRAQAKRKQIRK
jgi:hypothetical protein